MIDKIFDIVSEYPREKAVQVLRLLLTDRNSEMAQSIVTAVMDTIEAKRRINRDDLATAVEQVLIAVARAPAAPVNAGSPIVAKEDVAQWFDEKGFRASILQQLDYEAFRASFLLQLDTGQRKRDTAPVVGAEGGDLDWRRRHSLPIYERCMHEGDKKP